MLMQLPGMDPMHSDRYSGQRLTSHSAIFHANNRPNRAIGFLFYGHFENGLAFPCDSELDFHRDLAPPHRLAIAVEMISIQMRNSSIDNRKARAHMIANYSGAFTTSFLFDNHNCTKYLIIFEEQFFVYLLARWAMIVR